MKMLQIARDPGTGVQKPMKPDTRAMLAILNAAKPPVPTLID